MHAATREVFSAELPFHAACFYPLDAIAFTVDLRHNLIPDFYRRLLIFRKISENDESVLNF